MTAESSATSLGARAAATAESKRGDDEAAAVGPKNYLCFGLFGSGSGWLVIAALFLQSPVYLDQFGRKVMNRMTIGYNLGTACVLLFVVVRALLRSCGRDVSYPCLITAVSVGNAMALVIAASGITTIETLLFVSFLGGTFGWLSGIVHAAHLTLRYENVYSAVFSAGDAAAAVLAALLGLVQRPELGSEGWLFSPTVFFLLCLPLVVLALIAFWYIETTRLGALSASLQELRTSTASDVELSTPLKVGSNSCTHPADGRDGEEPPQQSAVNCFAVPRLVRGRLLVTATLMFVVFFEGIACWGFGDSLIPYVCGHAAPVDGGRACTFHCSFISVFACLAGAHLATIPVQPKMSSVCAPMLLFVAVFILFCLAATYEGQWANPLFDAEAASVSGAGTVYAVSLVFGLRCLATLMRSVAQRLIQTLYEPSEFEAMNAVLLWTSVAANVGGTAAVTTILEYG